MPKVSVIIPHFNQPDALTRCLQSLHAQSVDKDALDILVVDNGSSQKPEAAVAAFPNVRLFHEPTPGPGPARNLGVQEAIGDVLAFVDADCVPAPDWIETILLRIATGAEIIGGDVLILHRHPDNPTLWEAYESEFAYRMEYYIRDKGFSGTGNLAVRRTVFEKVGSFGGIETAEDMDWGQRATRAGHVIDWAPEVIVRHPARTTFSELARKWDRQIAHERAAVRGNGSGWRLSWALRALALAASPVLEVPRILRSTRIKGGWRGRVKAFAGLVAVRFHRARVTLRLAWRPNVDSAGRFWREG